MDFGHWNIEAVGEFNPADWFGFIYEIEHLPSGRTYIGKKFFKHKRQKTKKDKSRTKESDWRDYTSSSELLNDLITESPKTDFAFRILRLCSGKCELSYTEEELCFARDVLRARTADGTLKYLNRTIGYKNHAGLEKQTLESRRKLLNTPQIPR